MQISPFQFSLDLGTALSVLGACLVFFYNRKKQFIDLHRRDISNEYLLYSRKLIEFTSSFERYYSTSHRKEKIPPISQNDLIMIVSNIISFSTFVAIPALCLNNDGNKLHTVEKLVDDLENWHKETIDLFSGNAQGKFEYRYPVDVVGRLYSGIIK
ncbi:MAG: hypothetical protein GYA12_13085 [Chloroflexi bacterium]|nr:hypothetical protein [Chloroflexota bacterium]